MQAGVTSDSAQARACSCNAAEGLADQQGERLDGWAQMHSLPPCARPVLRPQDLQLHVDQIHGKLVDIMQDRVMAACR
jgi:hypothetical protein